MKEIKISLLKNAKRTVADVIMISNSADETSELIKIKLSLQKMIDQLEA